MRRILTIAALLVCLLAPAPAFAQSLIGQSSECGTYSFKEDLTKGRTDSMVVKIKHTEGCFTYDYEGYVPAGRGEAQGNPWQLRTCGEARRYVVNHFRWYRGIEVSESAIPDSEISCTPYHGDD